MRSSLPKVLHEVAGRSMVGHVLTAVDAVGAARTMVVVGHGRDAVRAHLAEGFPSAESVVQEQQNGTGHAVRVALDALDAQGAISGSVLVLTGDTPLLTSGALADLLAAHAKTGASATVLSAVLDDPTGYGRIVRDGDRVLAIVEHRDADAATLAITEINSGMFVFDAARLRSALSRLSTNNSQGEEYLTDVLAILREDGDVVGAVVVSDSDDVLGVNDRVQLAQAGRILRERLLDRAMRAGVTVIDPATTDIGSDVALERDVTLLPRTSLEGRTTIASGAVIGPDTTLRDCAVGQGARVRRTEATGAVLGARVDVGPFTYLRPGTVLHDGAKVGAYVEVKASVIGEGSKVPHLSYVGDAQIGPGTNLGAGTITVNYDGVAKHRTVVGANVRVGSDSMLVAPVTIGDGAYTAAGSVITDDVPPGAMAVGRARQRNVEGWVQRRRAGSASALAAAAAEGASSHVQDPSPALPEASAQQDDARGHLT